MPPDWCTSRSSGRIKPSFFPWSHQKIYRSIAPVQDKVGALPPFANPDHSVTDFKYDFYKVQLSTFEAESDCSWRGFRIYRLTSAKRYHVRSSANTSHFPTSRKEILQHVSGVLGMFLSCSCSACWLPLFAHWQIGDRFLSPPDLNSLFMNLVWKSWCGGGILWIII